MANLVRFRFKVDGLRAMVHNLDKRVLLEPAMHTAMEQIGAIGVAAAKQAAPRGPSSNGHVGGLTAAKFGMRLQATPMPLWVKVETTATRKWSGHGNYAYTKRVEWDPKLRHAAWLRKTFIQLRSRFDGALTTAAHAIQSGWA